MDDHDVVKKIKPLWRALVDIEKLGYEIYRSGNFNRGLDIACIARDVTQQFTREEQALVDKLAEEYRNGNH